MYALASESVNQFRDPNEKQFNYTFLPTTIIILCGDISKDRSTASMKVTRSNWTIIEPLATIYANSQGVPNL